SEPAPDCAKDPPTMQEVLVFCVAESFLECRHFPAVFEIAFYFLLQRLEHTRDADQDRNALPTNGFDHLRGFQFLLKDHGASQQRRQEHAQKLAKDMAEWQQVQKAQRMHEALILQIPLHLAFEWGSVGQNVPMSDHDALWCSRRARGEYNLEDVGGMDNGGRNFVSGSRRQFLKDQSRNPSTRRSVIRPFTRCDQKLWPHLLDDPCGEVGRGAVVHGNHNYTPERASEESRHPFRAILSTKQDAIALGYGPAIQFHGEARSHIGDLTVGE